jgi:xylulokinase
MTEMFLAADIGAGSLRVAAVDTTGRCAAVETRTQAVAEPFPGWAEIDPESWWRALCAGVGRVLDQLPKGSRPAALCLTGMTRSQILLDRHGRSLRAAILWRDGRASEDAATVARLLPSSGNPATGINAFHPLARLAWLRRAEPETFADLAMVLEPKDYLNYRITGAIGADGVTAARLDEMGPASADAPEWLAACLSLLAHPRPMPWSRIGEVTASEPPFHDLRGLPVFAGAMDTWAGAIGSGAAAPGQAYDVAGTSEAVGLVTRGKPRVPGLVTLPWTEDAYQAGGPTQAGGDAARWAYDAFRVRGPFETAIERAGSIRPSDDLPVFLPYLAGERAPVWRSDVRGAFHGVSRHHDGDALLWSALEGVAAAVRDILDAASAGSGDAVAEVRISGGGARSDAWCQLKANVIGVPVVRPKEIETGLIGCAAACAAGLGLFPTLAAAAGAMSRADRAFEPDRALATVFAARAERYRRLKRFALAMADGSGREGDHTSASRL